MSRFEAKALVEPQRIRASAISCELDQMTTALPGSGNGCLEKTASNTLGSGMLGDTDTFNLSTPTTHIGQVWNEGELEHPNNALLGLREEQEMIGIGIDRFPSPQIGG